MRGGENLPKRKTKITGKGAVSLVIRFALLYVAFIMIAVGILLLLPPPTGEITGSTLIVAGLSLFVLTFRTILKKA